MADMPSQVEQLQAELAALRGEMQDFSYIVSHDLRAPLRHIVSFAQLVQEDAGPQLTPEVQGFLGTITDSAQQLTRMLDGLLELSRVGTQPMQIGAVPLAALIVQCQTELAPRYAPQAIEWHVDQDMPAVQADAALLQMTLRQVLDNALKFSARRTSSVIHMDVQRDADHIVLSVRDNGAGFHPVQQGKLFQPFCRLHSTREFSGLGMGLACAYKAVQRMDGRLELAAVVDQGCTVRIRLPAG